MPMAFAQVDIASVNIFCENEILFGFTGLIPFLEICPIQGIPTGPVDSDSDGLLDSEEDANGNGIVDFGETNPNDPDTDGDALEDGWEIRGLNGDGSIPPVNGTPDLDLRALGADPLRADVFVEIDHMTLHTPNFFAVSQVVTEFANSPYQNPDDSTGITLHVDLNTSDEIPLEFNWVFFSNSTWPDYQDAKDQFFMTANERLDPNSANIRDAKFKTFHYGIFINSQENGSTGRGEIVGNDFVVSLGILKSDINAQAGTFMHELGHNLGLNHGGPIINKTTTMPIFDSAINCKPNYLSVMSYSRQMPYALKFFAILQGQLIQANTLDYSQSSLAQLKETALNEQDGIETSPPLELYTLIGGDTIFVARTGESVDWNRDSDFNDTVMRDINFINPPLLTLCPNESPNQILNGYEDWSNLIFNFRSDPINFADGLHFENIEPEPLVDIFDRLKQGVNNLNTTKDSFLTQGNAKQNEGINPILKIISSDKNRPVIAFDQTSVEIAAAGETLQSAKLRLYITDNGNNWGPTGRNIAMHSLTQNWEEGNGWNTGNNISGNGNGVTWNCPVDTDISNNQDDCITQWNGGSFTSIATDTVLITNNMVNQFIEFDVTSDVQAFLDGTQNNFGWIIKKGDEALNGSLDFASKEDFNNHPKLILTFEGQ
jgi:hypothetical protein